MSHQIYIIEHLEPKLWEWCIYEYEHVSKIVGKENLWFTNIKPEDENKLKKFGKVFTKPMKALKIENTCILDPEANELLNPQDAKNYDYFIFGGILGDYPPKKRTENELTKYFPQFEKRNLGKEQMATDNAIYVTHAIANGKKFEELKFQNTISIKLGKYEFTDLPYNYVLVNGKPLISKKVVKYLKDKEGF